MVHTKLLVPLHREQELSTAYVSDESPILILGHIELLVVIKHLRTKSRFFVADTLLVIILRRSKFIKQQYWLFSQLIWKISSGTVDQFVSCQLLQNHLTVCYTLMATTQFGLQRVTSTSWSPERHEYNEKVLLPLLLSLLRELCHGLDWTHSKLSVDCCLQAELWK